MARKGKKNEIARTSLALLYEVGREFASALDLRTVLHRVLFLSMKNVGAVSGSIIVLDENAQPVESAFLMNDRQHDQTTLQLRATYERGLAGWVARNRQAVLLQDTSKDERWLRRPDDDVDRTGPKSAVSAPILMRDSLVGVITLVHPQPLKFSSEHLELVQAIADQAGIAVLNARLYAESQRRAQVMTAVAESAAVITASLHLDEVLRRILGQISQALVAEGATLALIDPLSRMLELRASTLPDVQQAIGFQIALGEGIAGWVAEYGEGLVITNVQSDPRFSAQIDEKLISTSNVVMCAPLRSDEQVIGVLEVVNPVEGAFDPDDLHVLTGIGSMAGTAVRHAQLFENLQTAHKRYLDLFEDSIDPIFITDVDGRVMEANRQAERTVGVAGAELRSVTIHSLHKVDVDKVGQQFEKLSFGDTVTYEALLHARTGQEIPVQVYVRKIHQLEGMTQLQWILRDITERKNLDSLREDLTAMVYHDLRSPLANVVSSLDVLQTMLSDHADPTFAALLGIAMRSTERIQRLTNSLLDVNRLEAGQPIGNRSSTPVLPLTKEAADAVLPTAQNKELELVIAVPPDIPDIYVDADMIRRVIINLMENAVKFTPAKGTISVGAKKQGKFIRMTVEDSGPGISITDQERVFDKFTHTDAQDSPRGFGLGLAYCRLAVVGHGGRIWVDSETGSGSSFIFTLPITDDPERKN